MTAHDVEPAPAADGVPARSRVRSRSDADGSSDSPYIEFDRTAWRRLAAATPLPLTADDLQRLRSLDDPIELTEVDAIYRPLTRLLNLYAAASGRLHEATSEFLGTPKQRTPYVIGIAGSVAVGKSTVARLLRELLARWPLTPHVALVTTDGFLHPNAELERLGLMSHKGFPESYDRRRLLRFLQQVKAGAPRVEAPVYSHLTYDIVPGRTQVVERPDILIVEGLNVLQPARVTATGRSSLAVSDFFDFSIYLDAATADIERWYIERFLSLKRTAFTRPESFFRRFADLSDDDAEQVARGIWTQINEPNLVQNVLPTRGRATLVLTKGRDHTVRRVRLRKL